MNSALQQLLERRSQLEAQAEPLEERLQRCEWAIATFDEAKRLRDAALDKYESEIADQQIYRRAVDPDPGPLNILEIRLRLRQAQVAAQAALRVKPELQEQLQQIHTQQSQLALQLEEATWSDADAACAHLFEAVETDTAALRRSLAKIQSVSRHAYEQAHSQSNGREPTQHAAFRFWMRNEGRIAMVRQLGVLEPDYETGPALL
jgi:hypothetical protein